MSDFIADLERELLGAARRRAERRARSRLGRATTGPFARVLRAAAITLVAVTAGLAFTALHRASPHVAAAPPLSSLQLRAGLNGTTCANAPATKRVRPAVKAAPAQVVALLAVLRRAQTAADRRQIDDLAGLLPIADYDPKAVRAIPFYSSALRIVPTNDVLTATPTCGGGEHLGPGVCVMVSIASACFTVAEIRAGRAFGLAGVSQAYGRLIGVLRDGSAWALTKLDGHTRGLAASANIVEKYVAGARAGDTLDYAVYPRVPTATAPPPVAAKLVSRLQLKVTTTPQTDGKTTVFAPDARLGDAVAAITGGTRSSEAQGADVVVRMR